METDAYIALGSNQGDRELNLLRAVAEIGTLRASKVTGLSPFYSTSPVGNTDQPHFHNAVLRLATSLTPRELLTSLLDIETARFGRTRTVPWGPRTMDLDLLLYGDEVLDEEGLVVPHPRMLERRFVLQPLCDLAPELVHPVAKRTVQELLSALQSTDTVVRI